MSTAAAPSDIEDGTDLLNSNSRAVAMADARLPATDHDTRSTTGKPRMSVPDWGRKTESCGELDTSVTRFHVSSGRS